MGSVIQHYLDAELADWRVSTVTTYDDGPLSLRLRLTAGSVLAAAARLRNPPAGMHLHVSERFDLVRSLAIAAIARLRRVPVVITLHGAEFRTSCVDSPRLVRACCRARPS